MRSNPESRRTGTQWLVAEMYLSAGIAAHTFDRTRTGRFREEAARRLASAHANNLRLSRRACVRHHPAPGRSARRRPDPARERGPTTCYRMERAGTICARLAMRWLDLRSRCTRSAVRRLRRRRREPLLPRAARSPAAIVAEVGLRSRLVREALRPLALSVPSTHINTSGRACQEPIDAAPRPY